MLQRANDVTKAWSDVILAASLPQLMKVRRRKFSRRPELQNKDYKGYKGLAYSPRIWLSCRTRGEGMNESFRKRFAILKGTLKLRDVEQKA
eukprot:1160946-Pelagomonas_calceolata.AAC.6